MRAWRWRAGSTSSCWNSDTEPLPGTLAAIARRFDGDPRLGAVNGLQIDLRTQRPWWWGPHGYSCEKWLEREFDTAFKIEEGASGIRRSVYQRVGCFDERFFMLVEGRDLAARVVRSGYRIRYCPEVRFLHCQESNRPQTNAVYRPFRAPLLRVPERDLVHLALLPRPVRAAEVGCQSARDLADSSPGARAGSLAQGPPGRGPGAGLDTQAPAAIGAGRPAPGRQPAEPTGKSVCLHDFEPRQVETAQPSQTQPSKRPKRPTSSGTRACHPLARRPPAALPLPTR